MSTGVAIVGAAECDLGATGKSVLELQTQAVTRALADAGLTLSDVDGLATNAISRFSTTQLAEYLGIKPRWVDSTFVGGSAFELYIGRATQAIHDSAADVIVISYANDQRSAKSRSLAGVQDATMPDTRLEAPYHPLFPISFYAMAARRHMHDYGTKPEQLAEIAVAAREWALLNPKAFRYGDGPLTTDGVLSSPVVSSPLHTLDCCLVTDGGGAVVVTSLERARNLAKKPVEVLGYGEATTHITMSQTPSLTVSGAERSGADAFRRAGITPANIDLTQVYDSFTVTVLLTLEALGFCAPGDGGAFVADGRIRPGGDFALNTSGGGLSYCHPGQFGVLLLVEAIRQLRAECGARQVPNAEVALCHGTGGILSHHATVILGVDR